MVTGADVFSHATGRWRVTRQAASFTTLTLRVLYNGTRPQQVAHGSPLVLPGLHLAARLLMILLVPLRYPAHILFCRAAPQNPPTPGTPNHPQGMNLRPTPTPSLGPADRERSRSSTSSSTGAHRNIEDFYYVGKRREPHRMRSPPRSCLLMPLRT